MNKPLTAAKDPILKLGAVAYDPKVVTIWDGFQAFFKTRGLNFDYVLFTNYESQVEAHVAGHIDVAWNSPLAFIEAETVGARHGRKASAIAMRDSDQDLTSLIVTSSDGPIQTVDALRGKRVGVGASDSPQATLIPLLHLVELGMQPERDFEVVHHDALLGKHGDHIGGERDAVKALLSGTTDAACILDENHGLFVSEGTVRPGALRILTQTAPYDHCTFTVFEEDRHPKLNHFRELLLGMSYEDPIVRRLLDLEGLKAWRPGRATGYAQLSKAVDHFRFRQEWFAQQAR